MGFPKGVAEKALVDCGRCCAICHKFCGIKIELHHIKQAADGGEDTYNNCIPLCFDCHAEVKAYNPRHPKGRQYTESELAFHRDKWYEKQKNSGGLNVSLSATALDISTFRNLQELLSESNVPFLFHYDYHSDFDISTSNALYSFIDHCYNPNFEFIDADMESLKSILLKACEELTCLFAELTDISGDKLVVSDDIDERTRVHYATLAVKSAFDDIIKLGRRKYLSDITA